MEIFLGIGTVRECPENCCGLIVWNLCIKFCFGVYKTENGNGNRFHQEELT